MTAWLIAGTVLGSLYLLTHPQPLKPVTWDIEWENDLPTKVTIQGKFKVLV
jgi:hypothetical protein